MRVQKGKQPAAGMPFEFPMSSGAAETLAESGRAYFNACLEWQKELADFTNERLHKDLDLQRSAAQCKNAGELAKLHQEWVETTLKDYVRETEKLTTLFRDAAFNGAKSVEAAAEASKPDVTSK
ncbi:hypothetical protein GR183_17275 [Stappia sp. GBMRC 2046]|uniref:Phasin domain-containing protein n=1 Tax=Stappia sediminis TaxID=2692190 RepID=A0A7X3LWY7_9HYPH|nr:phasin family protein [Stappia sediminis]MXN66671.1 hypothetical protein [Stappia sediminis]